jgi:hypothetical protein
MCLFDVLILLYCSPIILLYSFFCFTLPFIRIGEIKKGKGVDLFVCRDLIHSDFVFKSSLWSEVFEPKDEYIKIGWGDRKIFLETKVWANLRAFDVMKAFVGINKTVLRVEFLDSVPENCVKMEIDDCQLEVIKIHVNQSFSGKLIKKQSWHCESGDFYESKLRYNCITNCNNWVNRALFVCRATNRIWCPLSLYF